jgi:hypothetical protein
MKYIKENKKRGLTFNKRKDGLLKKAMELSILTDTKIFICVKNENGQIIQYTSDPYIKSMITSNPKPQITYTNKDYETLVDHKHSQFTTKQTNLQNFLFNHPLSPHFIPPPPPPPQEENKPSLDNYKILKLPHYIQYPRSPTQEERKPSLTKDEILKLQDGINIYIGGDNES